MMRIARRMFLLPFVALSIPSRDAASQSTTPSLADLPPGVETRWASPENPTGARGAGAQADGGRKGSPTITVKAGESVVLAEARATSGTVRRIWMTFIPKGMKDGPPCCSALMLRSMRIDIYWDGAKTPAVSAPLGDFFGLALGQATPFQSALFSSPEGRSLNAAVPMPFRTGMRIVLTNEADVEVRVYYDVDYTLGDRHSPTTGYFHAVWRRERPTRMKRDYEILPRVKGHGRYLGANIGVIADKEQFFDTWWGEGEVKIYVDGDSAHPTMSGTGTEDYIGTGFSQGQYAHQYQGSPVSDTKAGRYAFYRYHVPDPVYFQREARVTIQQIGFFYDPADHTLAKFAQAGRKMIRTGSSSQPPGESAAMGTFERADDWSSCAYFYLDRPENGLPPLAPVSERVIGL